ncbi:hypothetical protein V1478_016437 [Vespula squamosa]|uniref:Uncharacterized protein n=1 Tax=Vespula squamosa TaxID=30214 RepID=A0ABD1ZZT0_VESSQ
MDGRRTDGDADENEEEKEKEGGGSDGQTDGQRKIYNVYGARVGMDEKRCEEEVEEEEEEKEKKSCGLLAEDRNDGRDENDRNDGVLVGREWVGGGREVALLGTFLPLRFIAVQKLNDEQDGAPVSTFKNKVPLNAKQSRIEVPLQSRSTSLLKGQVQRNHYCHRKAPILFLLVISVGKSTVGIGVSVKSLWTKTSVTAYTTNTGLVE